MLRKITGYFSKGETALWLSSVMLVAVSFFAFDRSNYLSLAGSLIGVTSLIFSAKGNPAGQILMIVFMPIRFFLEADMEVCLCPIPVFEI